MPGDHPDRRLADSADIVFTAKVRADELRFHAAPGLEVTFTGEPAERSASGSARENLPDRVTPGTIYRKVEVHYVSRPNSSPPAGHPRGGEAP